MSKKYSLEGKVVSLCLNGTWEFTGRVEFMDADKIVLTGSEGPLVVYRTHIIAAMIVDETQSEDSIDEKSTSGYNNSTGRAPQPQTTGSGHRLLDENDQESYYGSIIPNDMLIGEDTSPEVSFSMSMPDLRNKNKRGEITYGPSEENGSNRKKDTE